LELFFVLLNLRFCFFLGHDFTGVPIDRSSSLGWNFNPGNPIHKFLEFNQRGEAALKSSLPFAPPQMLSF
jgi:hypothetical protein